MSKAPKAKTVTKKRIVAPAPKKKAVKKGVKKDVKKAVKKAVKNAGKKVVRRKTVRTKVVRRKVLSTRKKSRRELSELQQRNQRVRKRNAEIRERNAAKREKRKKPKRSLAERTRDADMEVYDRLEAAHFPKSLLEDSSVPILRKMGFGIQWLKQFESGVDMIQLREMAEEAGVPASELYTFWLYNGGGY